MADLILEITGIKRQNLSQKILAKIQVPQIQPIPDEHLWFVKMPEYDLDVKNRLADFLNKLFKFLIGEGDDVSDWGSSGSE